MHRMKSVTCPRNAYCLQQSFLASSSSRNPTYNPATKKKYYQDLEISSDATHAQIKVAYYKLSKMYHPDIAKDNDTSATKFREITEAYEVLGNYRLRRNYDRGILNPGDHLHKQSDVEEEVYKGASKFYESREVKSRPPTHTGKTPIYDFDEFYRMHYGSTLERDFRHRKNYDAYKRQAEESHKHSGGKNEMILFSSVAIIILTLLQVIASLKTSVDSPSYDDSTGSVD